MNCLMNEIIVLPIQQSFQGKHVYLSHRMQHLLLIQLTCCPDCNLSADSSPTSSHPLPAFRLFVPFVRIPAHPRNESRDRKHSHSSPLSGRPGLRLEADLVTHLPCNAFLFPSAVTLILRQTNKHTGNEGGFFEMHDQTGDLFLVREIDLESLPAAVLTLQIQVKSLFAITVPSPLIPSSA